jgi:putative peptidoglycan lipid II flippase
LLWLASGLTANAHGVAQAALLLVLIAGGIAIYGLLLLAFRVTTPDEVVNTFSRKGHRGLHM